MWAEKGKYVLVVWPTAAEVERLRRRDAESIGERFGITQADANIAIRRLSELQAAHSTVEPDELPRAQLLPDGDLTIYLPDVIIDDVPSDRVGIERSAIETPLIVDEEFRQGLLKAAIPSGGVVVDFTRMYSGGNYSQ